MATRSVVIVKDNDKENWIYHHWDGYPEGVGFDLVRRSKKFKSYEDKWYGDDITNKLVKDTTDSYEITNGYHKDIDFLYVIDCQEEKIKCFRITKYDWNTYRDIINSDNKIDLLELFKKKEVEK